MAAIRLATASNVRSFQNLAHTLVTSDGKWEGQIDQEALEDEFGRFRVWSGNLGALQKGHSSLDYRLRDSPLLSGNALRFLEELNQNLTEAIAIVSGSRLPFEEQPKPDSNEEKDEEDDDGFFSDDDEDDEAGGSKKELTMRYEEVVDIIDNLYKLSVRIRTPTIRSRSLKAASYKPKDPETGVDILGTYAQYDKQHTNELLRSLRQPHVDNAQIEDDYLASRLAYGITLRRRQFKYWRRHRDKLSMSAVPEENWVQPERTVEQVNVSLPNDTEEVYLPQPAIVFKEAPSQKTGKTILSGTEATQHHQSLDDIVDTKSVTSYAVTVTDIHGKGVNLPPPPKCADGERDFECPFCYIICPARYGRGRPWRTHLLQDLQPYVCTYTDCEASEQLFRSRREWNEHEAGHRKAWRCPEHPSAVYRSRTGLEGHLRQQHLDSFPESQLDTIVKIGESSMVEMREKCPICFLSADAEGMGDFTSHVANHLERFAAFALPNSNEEDTDGASSVASRGRSGSTTSQDMSDMSLPNDVSDEQEHFDTPITELRRGEEDSLVYTQNLQAASTGPSLLSAASLLALPDGSRNRLDTLLSDLTDGQEYDQDDEGKHITEPTNIKVHSPATSLRYTAEQLEGLRQSPLVRKPDGLPSILQWLAAPADKDNTERVKSPEQEGNNENEDEDEDEDDTKVAPTDFEEHLERLESFRAYLLSLPGAQTVRFFKRYGSWKGQAIFNNAAQTAQAVNLFDESLYPEVKIQQGSEGNSNKLKFSVPSTQESHWQPLTRQSTSDIQKADDLSSSSASLVYDDVETSRSKEGVLSVSDIPILRDMYRSRKLLQRDQSFVPNDSFNRIISFCYHDLTRMKVDAIVNSANVSMNVSRDAMTLNSSIHKAGGPKFTEEAQSKGKLKPGQAVLTNGHNLPCHHVIHAVRPQYSKNKGMGQFNILTECYRSALKIALFSNFKTVAFPCLGTGGCGFPPRIAARVALQEVREFLDANTQHPFERIVFVVRSVLDEKAYMDMFPVFFPPTHGDLEVARSSDLSASRASLAAQVLETRLQVQKVAEALSAELSLFIPDFPKEILEELHGIDAALASIRGFLLGPNILERGLNDLNLLCYVMQTVCGSITEITESAKSMPFSGGRSHKGLWDDYNNHQKMVHNSDLEEFLRDCRDFAQCLDDILTHGGVELDEMTPMRLRLDSFKAKQRNQDAEGAREHFDEVLYTREFQRETDAQPRDIVRLHQIPSIAQLYAAQKLEEKSTMVKPSALFNHTVCLVREDITKLDVTVMVNSTDPTFAGMGTLDRKVRHRGGFELREECTKFGICKEGDVRTTPGFGLPAKHVLHVVPPEQWRKNSKEVFRQIYREILYTASSLGATSIAIPAIGTGMLNYPKRDCTALAMEEIYRFLDTIDPSNLLEKIIFVVYSSNDEFVYKSLLPVYFPPVHQNIDRALPASHPIPTSTRPPPEKISAPRRTLFNSIGDAVRNLGSSIGGKRPVSHTSRAINSYEEHALIGFESHAQGCDTCKTMEKLCLDGEDLCERGYPLAQTLLWYMNLGPDKLVYTRPVQIRQSIRLEVPEEMFPLSLTLLRLVEESLREEGREHPFVSGNRAYSTVVQGQSAQDDESSGPTIYNAETARASVEVWSTSERTWSPVSPSECIVFVRTGRIDVYEAHAPSTAQEPLLTFVLDPAAKITKHEHRPGLVVRGAVAAQFDNNEEIMLVSQDVADSASLLAMLQRANPEFPASRADLETDSGSRPATKANRSGKELGPTTKVSTENVESDSEPDSSFGLHPKSTDHLQNHPEGRLSLLQEKMHRLSEAASRFDVESPEQQAALIHQLGNDTVLPDRTQSFHQNEEPDGILEYLVLHHLTQDLRKRPGSYIGKHIIDVAAALDRPLLEVSAAAQNLAKNDRIHNTIDKDTWVLSHLPDELPDNTLPANEFLAQRAAFKAASKSKVTAGNPSLEFLEQQLLAYFASYSLTAQEWSGCNAQHIARALKRDVIDIEAALSQLAKQGKVRLSLGDNLWKAPMPERQVSSNPEATIDATGDVPTTQAAAPSATPGHQADKSDLLFQMTLLEQQILSYFTSFNSTSPLEKGCTAKDLAAALDKDIEDVELALDQLAEQGKMHLAPGGETWNTPLPRQYNPSGSSSRIQATPLATLANIRDATDFKDTPPSPVIPATTTPVQDLPIDLADVGAPESSNSEESSIYPFDPISRWTRIDKSYVDPQVLKNAGEEFHEEGYSLIIHRILRRGELKQWVQSTLDLRLGKGETARARRGVSGHTWLSKGKGKERERDERDLHQANLDRVLAGDMKEDELRHFAKDEEAEKKR